MKKVYSKPMAEKVEFSFNNHVIASGIPVGGYWDTHGTSGCCLSADNSNCQSGTTPNIKAGYDCTNHWSLR